MCYTSSVRKDIYRMRRVRVLFLALLFSATLFALSRPGSAGADMYRYVDDKGTVNVTDSMENVPEEYRGRAELVREEDLPEAEAPFARTEREIEEQKKPVNRAISRVRELLEGRGLRAAVSSAIALVLMVLALKAVRPRGLKAFFVILILAALAVYLAVLFASGRGGIWKALGEGLGKAFR